MRQASVLDYFFAVFVSSLLAIAAIAETGPGEEGATLAASLGIPLPPIAPERGSGEGQGALLIDSSLTRVMLVDGLGSPPRGPVSIIIEQDTIVAITSRAPAPGRKRNPIGWPWQDCPCRALWMRTCISGTRYKASQAQLRPPSMYLSCGWLTALLRCEMSAR